MLSEQKKLTASTRIVSMLVDHIFMCMIALIFSLPFFIKVIVSSIQQDIQGFPEATGLLFYLSLIGYAAYFCKDSFNGRSITKRMFKLQVVNNRTGAIASPWRCMIRNIFCMLWPLEVVMIIINPNRRLGDYVAGTSVVEYNATTLQPKPDVKNIIGSFLLAYALIVLLMIALGPLALGEQKVNYIKSTYNEKASKELEKSTLESLSKYLTVKAKVYDQSIDTSLKYISIRYHLKSNYLSDDTKAKNIYRITLETLYQFYPENSFTGDAHYKYEKGFESEEHSFAIGVRIDTLLK